MSPDALRLALVIQQFEALGCWYLAKILRDILNENLEANE